MAACAFACRFEHYIPLSSCVQTQQQQICSSQQLSPCSVSTPGPCDAAKYERSTRLARASAQLPAKHLHTDSSAQQKAGLYCLTRKNTHGQWLWTLASEIKLDISSMFLSSGSQTKRQAGLPGTYQLQLLHKPSIHWPLLTSPRWFF